MRIGDLPENESIGVVEPNTYDVRCVAIEYGMGEKGAYCKCEYTILGPENKNRKIWENISLSHKSLWRLKKWLICFGVDENQDLPIQEGPDKKILIDEQALFNICCQLVEKRDGRVDVDIQYPDEEGKKKGYKPKNYVSNYIPPQQRDSSGW